MTGTDGPQEAVQIANNINVGNKNFLCVSEAGSWPEHLWGCAGALNKDNDGTEQGNGSFLLMFLSTEHWDFPSPVSPCGWYSEELPQAEALAEEVLE